MIIELNCIKSSKRIFINTEIITGFTVIESGPRIEFNDCGSILFVDYPSKKEMLKDVEKLMQSNPHGIDSPSNVDFELEEDLYSQLKSSIASIDNWINSIYETLDDHSRRIVELEKNKKEKTEPKKRQPNANRKSKT